MFVALHKPPCRVTGRHYEYGEGSDQHEDGSDVKKSTVRKLLRIRIRIIWPMSNGHSAITRIGEQYPEARQRY